MTEIPGEFPLPEEAAQRQRSLLGAHIEAERRSARTTRRGLVAVARSWSAGFWSRRRSASAVASSL